MDATDKKFIPRGAEAELPAQPTAEEIVAGETGAGAVALWDKLMPDHKGLLLATPLPES